MGKVLHHSVSRAADVDANKIAFKINDESISYGELDTKSNQLANLLVANGVKRSDRVGIYMNKCLQMPVSVYGILKAGAAYVPIDQSAPLDRVRFIVENCGIRILITNSTKVRQVRDLLADCHTVECVVGIDGTGIRYLPWTSVFSGDNRAVVNSVSESDLAYIMYTSGSTGTPKGLMHTHRSGLSYATYSAKLYGLRASDVLGNHSPLHFDMSTFEFFAGPYCGSTSVLIAEESMMFPVALGRLIENEKLTIWYSVPLALIQMVNQGELEKRDLTSLRWVNFAGEPFPPKYLHKLMQLVPNARFSNVYGPAEVNQCTYFHIPIDFPPNADSVPIGRVWEGARGKILDENDSEIEKGEVGELVICSDTMMDAYWKRDDLNEIAFYRARGEKGEEETYYRTGDLVRINAKGELLFLGRKDRQIKIRGYRIELDEIENVIVQMPAIEEVAVIAITNSDGIKEIYGAVTIKPGMQISEPEIRNLASKKLPSYGVPTRIEARQSLPRTTSGKIDRKILCAEFQALYGA